MRQFFSMADRVDIDSTNNADPHYTALGSALFGTSENRCIYEVKG